MRVTSNLMNTQALNDIQNVLRRYGKLNEQLTTGKKVRYPSDNATVAARVSDLDSRIREVQRYKSNISLARSYTDMYDSSLQEMSSIYQRVKELSVRGANDSLSDEDRQAIVTEIDKINDHMKSLANSQVSGKYIYGGAESDKAPVDKNGEIQTSPKANIKKSVSVGGYKVDYGLTVYDVFTTNSGTSVFKHLDRMKDAIASGNNNAIDREMGAIEDIQRSALKGLAEVGGNDRLLELSESRMEDFEQFNTEFLSKESDADLAKVLTDLSMQQVVMQSALKTTAKIIPPTLVDFL
ncbi:flagellar hook-associated protein FlgL [Geotoga petraea]|jgi:flagellar hook-associated protein 3 FlgL|uniref:Flagellar hook-associated protein 3 n=1 Tax=Geotoga petraea TaxID=28234 RepID=A0A1G6HW67_9BACT|nr:flagellar hook-associated protein FlgL [Geotoga petraea]MDK2945319.1 flagellar hook-associated protein 3 FlgL [Geotoga sp.]TGG88984.1 flagellar hook-associated protein 3 [Geotoga petraea]SDB98075.1 flagellar hook-associated protein 3 FlgL [Geotoga petraea]